MSIIGRTGPRYCRATGSKESSAEAGVASAAKPSGYFRWKGAIDRLLAAILLVPGLPAIVLLASLVRLTSRGPGIFRQSRVGKGNRLFTLYKIRTMRIDAEEDTGPTWSQPHDDRVTRLGRLLRRFHLDELPQLINVLKGNMSLVGPRPERPEFVQVLGELVPGYCDRLAVKPGITGLAQLNLPPDSDIASVRRKLFLDLEYIRQAGLLMDLRILLCTSARIVKLPVLKILGLRRAVPSFVDEDAAEQGKTASGNGNGKATLDHVVRQLALRGKASPLSFGGNGNGNGDHATQSKPHPKPR
jgi:lipopolysaccharide/colanic/teichoic acid biosynthesis glycosyltransferase